MAGDKNNLRMKVLALYVDFSSPSANPLRSGRVAQAGIKKGTFLKSGYLSVIGLSGVKIVADMHRHAACHKFITSTSDELLRNVNIDDLK